MSFITCPQCRHEFLPPDRVQDEIKARLRKEVEGWMKKKEEEFKNRESAFQAMQEARELEFMKQREEERRKWTKQVEEEMRRSMATEYELKLKWMEEREQRHAAEVQEAQKLKLDYLRLQEEMRQKESALALQMEKTLMEERTRIQEQMKKEVQEWQRQKDQNAQLKIAELEKQLADQRKLAEEMKRKVEQGSMQLQGEVQEIALENLLRQAFPFDRIEEVGKGVRGADCIQTVNSRFGQPCGKIIYESKRTKEFSMDWVDKLKEDMRRLGADVAVIVSQALPRDLEQFGQIDGVWVCGFHEVAPLASVLRDLITKVYQASQAQENKGDKMTLLYEYLISPEFSEQWKAIREGFMSMRLSLQKERVQMEKIWKHREKQLDKVLLHAAQIKGSIEGISGMEQLDFDLLDEGESGAGLLE